MIFDDPNQNVQRCEIEKLILPDHFGTSEPQDLKQYFVINQKQRSICLINPLFPSNQLTDCKDELTGETKRRPVYGLIVKRIEGKTGIKKSDRVAISFNKREYYSNNWIIKSVNRQYLQSILKHMCKKLKVN